MRWFVTMCLAAALASACGCQSASMSVLMDRKQAQAAGLSLGGPLACDAAGNLYLASGGHVWRIAPKGDQVQQQTPKPLTALTDLSVAPDGVLLVLRANALSAMAGQEMLAVTALPGRPRLLAAGADGPMVALEREGKHQVMRYRLAGRRLEPVFQSPRPVTALCALPDGLLAGVGESIFKIALLPPAKGEPAAQTQVVSSFVCAIYGAEITSIAADPQRRLFYFSDGRATFFWADNQVRQLLPAGGRLALADDRLVIASSDQILAVPRASSRCREILRVKSAE